MSPIEEHYTTGCCGADAPVSHLWLIRITAAIVPKETDPHDTPLDYRTLNVVCRQPAEPDAARISDALKAVFVDVQDVDDVEVSKIDAVLEVS